MFQDAIWQITVGGIAFILVVQLYVYLNSTRTADAEAVKGQFYQIRPYWFGLLLVIIVVMSTVTLASLPYDATHDREGEAADIEVNVKAHQWYWEMDRTEFPVGKDIAFQVTSADVNHDFAIYGEDDRVIAQTQAMPGYTNVLRHTFEEQGTYKILCLEYCGLAHHRMITELTVTNQH